MLPPLFDHTPFYHVPPPPFSLFLLDRESNRLRASNSVACYRCFSPLIQGLSLHCAMSFKKKPKWPPYSPDLTPCDFYLWGYLKGRVYRDRPATLEALREAITREIRAITPDTLRKVTRNFVTRLQMVQDKEGQHIEHL